MYIRSWFGLRMVNNNHNNNYYYRQFILRALSEAQLSQSALQLKEKHATCKYPFIQINVIKNI